MTDVFSTTLTAISTAVTGNVTTILPVAGTLFALMFGVKLIPKLIQKFSK